MLILSVVWKSVSFTLLASHLFTFIPTNAQVQRVCLFPVVTVQEWVPSGLKQMPKPCLDCVFPELHKASWHLASPLERILRALIWEKACSLCQLKKMHNLRIVKFYLGQNEGCSPRGSTWESSEGLLWKGSGAKSTYKVLVKGNVTAIKHLCYKRFSPSHEDLMSPWRIPSSLSAFLDIRRGRDWDHKIFS